MTPCTQWAGFALYGEKVRITINIFNIHWYNNMSYRRTINARRSRISSVSLWSRTTNGPSLSRESPRSLLSLLSH